jgi:hypothetical protein
VSGHANHVIAIDEAGDIAALVGMYAAMDAEARGDVIACAVEAMARMRIAERGHASGLPSGSSSTDHAANLEDEAEEWIARLAVESFPHGDDAAGLWVHARSVEPSAREALFPDGMSQVVLAASDSVWSDAEAFYCGYTYIRATTDATEAPPEPAGVLGVQVPTTDFERWESDDDGWVLETDAWTAEVERRCIAACASMIHRWRRVFFARVLGQDRPSDEARR